MYLGKDIPRSLQVTYMLSKIAYAFAPSEETLPPYEHKIQLAPKHFSQLGDKLCHTLS